jgi:glycolate oxidase subunit GlcD
MRSSVDQLIETLQAVVGHDAVLAHPDELLVYECDGLPQHKYLPRAVVFPNSTEQTAEVMRALAVAGVPFTPRGAGTGLSGGALALERGVVVELARMRRILQIDEANRLAVVQTGVVNSQVSRAVAPLGLHYVPDPSSQPTCTIGGNIGENAGGVHCLKYGTTTDHVLAIRVVLAGGEIVDLGSTANDAPGFDLRGVFIGSEGTFGIATEATLRLVPVPPAVRTLLAEFPEVNDASHAVSAIIAAGLVPAGLEMMDREIIRAVEASVFAAGLPPDAGAALLIELDGLAAGIDDDAERVRQVCMQHGARDCRLARDENERKKLWAARKGAFGAIGRIAPDSMIQDAVVPRSRLPQIMADAYQIASKYQLRIANVFHAGDGNLHPLICFDSRSVEEVRRVKEAGRELMETCVRSGGTITGEHGVGLDKRNLLPLVFSEDDMETMLRVRAAFDPTGLMNPGKIIPILRGCGEARAVAVELGTVGDGGKGRGGEGESGRVGESESGGGGAGKISSGERETVREGEGGTARAEDANPQGSQIGHLSTAAKFQLSGNHAVTSHPVDPERIARQLHAIIGAESVSLFSGSSLPPFSPSPLPPISPSPPPTSEPVLAAPGSIDEACEIMKLASKERWAVLPGGRGSWLDVGNPLARVDVIISTRRLNRIIEHEPADLVAMTEAGVTLDHLNHELMRKGQWLPLDPLGYKGATIGGIVAAATSGPHRHGYGPTRGFVIGLKVVLADGRVVKAGGRVVKNVAGYDLCKLFTGSFGTLGIIVEANFKLRPRPEQEASVVASGSMSALITAAQSILRIPLFPVAVELLSAPIAQSQSPKADPVLLIRFAGNCKAVNEQTETALSLLQNAHQVSSARIIEDDRETWQQLAARMLPSSNDISWRASVPPAEVQAFIDLLLQNHSHTSLRWQAGIAAGTIQVCSEFEPEDANIPLLQGLRSECQRLGGSLIVEHAPLPVKATLDAWGDMGKSVIVMQRIKQQLDPEGILSPGRFGF